MFQRIAVVALLSVLCVPAVSQPTPGSARADSAGASGAPASRIEYTLPPDKLQKAHALYVQAETFQILEPLYGIAVLLGILYFGVAARFRDFAERKSRSVWVRGSIVLPLFVATAAAMSLPIDAYHHHVSFSYGLSIEGWGAWLLDWLKTLLLTVALETVLLLLLYLMIRRSPRWWWFYGWLMCVPVLVFVWFIQPVVVEPMFYKFTALERSNPELVAQIERVVKRGGLDIPRSRMYSMNASTKLTGDNAYVSGFGASKRVVVWDTTQKHLTNPEIMFVFGHEMGHYVLGHIVKGIVLLLTLLLASLYVSYLCCGWMLRRWGAAWRIRDMSDWASAPLLVLLISLFAFVSTPLQNGISRHFEHQADTYGLEAIHGLVPDSQRVAAQAFQILGENWLDYPDMSDFVEWWGWDHPATRKRLDYAQDYDPWAQGKEPEFVKSSVEH